MATWRRVPRWLLVAAPWLIIMSALWIPTLRELSRELADVAETAAAFSPA